MSNIWSTLDAMRKPNKRPVSGTPRVPLAETTAPGIPDATHIPLANVTETNATASGMPNGIHPSAQSTTKKQIKPQLDIMSEEELKQFSDVRSVLWKYVVQTMPIRVIFVDPEITTAVLRLMDRSAVVNHILESMKKDKAFSQRNVNIAKLCAEAKEKARFGILSHRWEEELKYQDIDGLSSKSPDYSEIIHAPGYVKLDQFCGKLRPRKIQFAWADTICINKFSSTELDESIRSMFKWYQKADICIVYLAQTTSIAKIGDDKWFTRGWTLQELLAPRKLKYYGQNWKELTTSENDKKRDSSNKTLYDAVAKVTQIPDNEITNFSPQAQQNVSTRMSWMARRETTVDEDMTYALMGIFGVSMSPAYGEGAQRAFLRLFKELLDVSSSLDLYNWASDPVDRTIHCSRMLPSSPKCFLEFAKGDVGKSNPYLSAATDPPTLTSIGLRIKVLPVMAHMWPDAAYHQGVYFKTSLSNEKIPARLLTDAESFKTITSRHAQLVLGIINFPSLECPIPETCLAVVMYRMRNEKRWVKIPTANVVWFDCKQTYRSKVMNTVSLDDLSKGEDAEIKDFETVYL